jgi:hypothetical protein
MCDCIERLNAILSGHNTRICEALEINRSGGGSACLKPVIQTEKINKKGREKLGYPLVVFCPFCGLKYGQEKTEDNQL